MKKIDFVVDCKLKKKPKKVKYDAFVSSKPKKKGNRKKKLRSFLVFASVFLIVFSAIGIWGLYKLYLPGMALKDQAYVLLEDMNVAKGHLDNQNLIELQSQISVIEEDLSEFSSQYEYFSFAEKTPFVKGYYLNGKYLVEAAKLSLPLGQDLLTSATPIADVFGYKTVDGEQEEVVGQEKIETIIRNLPDISTVLSGSESQIDQILESLTKIDPKYIPSKVGDIEIKSKFDEVEDLLKDSKNLFSDIQDVLKLIPNIAGADEEKTYLILFQNDMELRPTGGFITAFGYAEVDKGVLGDIESEDIYNLDQKIYSWEKAPKEVLEYLGVSEWHIRDVNIYTDLVSTSEKFKEMYKNQYSPRDFDGIIYLDTGFVESLISVVGPIELTKYNEVITADNVVDELEMYSEKILTGGSDRKQFMEDLMGELVSRIIEARSEEWGGLIEAVWGSLESKNLQFYFHDDQVQTLASKYGFTGEVEQSFEGDYLYIVESNMGGLKSNMYVTSEVYQNIDISEEGVVTKNVTVRWENPEPKDFWLNGPYRNWVRIYVPNGSELLGNGVTERVINEDWNEQDYGKTIYEAFITVPVATGCSYYEEDEDRDCDPGVYELSFSYKLPFSVSTSESYPLFIQKQPSKDDEKQTINFGNKEFEFILNKDLELFLDFQ